MAETQRPECVRLWKEYIELILFRGSIFLWSPIAIVTSCFILAATINAGLVFSNNLLNEYIDNGCLPLSTLRSDTQAIAAFILVLAVITMIAEAVILVIRAAKFGIKIKEINKYSTVLFIVDIAITPFFALCYLIGGAVMARRSSLWEPYISLGAYPFCSIFVINPTDDNGLINDPTFDARVVHHSMAINAAASMVCMVAFILLGIWRTVILGWTWYQKKYGDGDDAKEMEAK